VKDEANKDLKVKGLNMNGGKEVQEDDCREAPFV